MEGVIVPISLFLVITSASISGNFVNHMITDFFPSQPTPKFRIIIGHQKNIYQVVNRISVPLECNSLIHLHHLKKMSNMNKSKVRELCCINPITSIIFPKYNPILGFFYSHTCINYVNFWVISYLFAFHKFIFSSSNT